MYERMSPAGTPDAPVAHARAVTRSDVRIRAFIAVPAAVLLIVIGFLLKAGGAFEMPLSHALNLLHHGVIGALGNALYHGIGPAPAIVGTVVITAVILLVSRSWQRASTFAVTIAVSWLSMAVVKLLVHRPRPIAAQLALPYHPAQIDASYPSGHMAFASAVVVTTILLIRPGTLRRVLVVVGALLLVGVALLLTIDGVHYPTDVTASLLWVLAVAPLVFALWVRYALPWLARRLPRDRSPLVPGVGRG